MSRIVNDQNHPRIMDSESFWIIEEFFMRLAAVVGPSNNCLTGRLFGTGRLNLEKLVSIFSIRSRKGTATISKSGFR